MSLASAQKQIFRINIIIFLKFLLMLQYLFFIWWCLSCVFTDVTVDTDKNEWWPKSPKQEEMCKTQ